MKVEPAITRVLTYFSVFEYPPTSKEIHTFVFEKVSEKEIAKTLHELVKTKRFEALGRSEHRYSLKGDSKFFDQYITRRKVSQHKIDSAKWFFTLAAIFPAIHFVGISGSLAMLNGEETDDIDICIITGSGRLWTGRLIAVVIALVLGRKRSYGDTNVKDKLCLNLYFDESGMVVPKVKQNEYIAHEILQMKPVINKYQTYERFLRANRWVQNFFPNFDIPSVEENNDGWMRGFVPALREWSEFIVGKIQLYSINRRRTKEIITDTQLWFFPDDFEKKLKKKIKIKV